MKYEIIRYYKSGYKMKPGYKNLTLEEAQAHCQRPDTKKEGVWFDGFNRMDNKNINV